MLKSAKFVAVLITTANNVLKRLESLATGLKRTSVVLVLHLQQH